MTTGPVEVPAVCPQCRHNCGASDLVLKRADLRMHEAPALKT